MIEKTPSLPHEAADLGDDADIEGSDVGTQLSSPESYRAALTACQEVTEAVAAECALDDLLELIARRLCELCQIRRCWLYMHDERTQLFKGRVAYHIDGTSNRQLNAAVKRAVAGVAADRFTQEIVRTKAPVLVRDALHDPRPVHAPMREWKVRSIFGVPMLAGDDIVGICYLDNEGEPHPFTVEQRVLAATFANLAAVAIVQAQHQDQRREALQTISQQNQLLRRAREIDERLMQLTLEGASLTEILSVVFELAGKPCFVYDIDGRRVVSDPSSGSSAFTTIFDDGRTTVPAIAAALTALDSNPAVIIEAFPSEGVSRRSLVAPVIVDGARWGYLLVVETPNRFRALDALVVRRTALTVAGELTAAQRATAARGEASESLAIDLVRGGNHRGSLESRANFLGVRIDTTSVVAIFARASAGQPPATFARKIVASFKDVEPTLQVLATTVPEGAVAIIELPEGRPAHQAKETICRAAKDVAARIERAESTKVALSPACEGVGDIPWGYAQARKVLALMESYSVASSVLAADELGVGRLLLLSTDREEMDRYVRDVLGQLIDSAGARTGELFETLQHLVVNGFSIRRTATSLAVHENTIRYRCARIKELTSLDVQGSTNDQLAAQLALIVLRLEGHIDAITPS